MSTTDSSLTRRRFLEAASRSGSGLALAGLGEALLGAGALSGCTLPPRSFRAAEGPAVEIPLAAFPELERPGGVVKVLTARHRAVLVRAEEGGGFRAFSAVCTHQGCLVSPSAAGFRCPCHGSTYDREGRNTGGPAQRPLAQFAAERRGGNVVLVLP
jgi:cytochrome b6-f complex iron-sulfur subunit